MKLLWVKAGGLLPPDMGGKIRSYNILKQLARRHEITLFTFYPEHPDDQHLRGNGMFSKLVPVPLPLPPRRSLGEYARSARMMAAGRPVTIDKFLYPEVRRRYAELLHPPLSMWSFATSSCQARSCTGKHHRPPSCSRTMWRPRFGSATTRSLPIRS